MVVLDTNVVSELMRDDPHSDVLVWLDDRPTRELFVTAVTEAEVRTGIAFLPEAARAYAEIAAARRVAGRPSRRPTGKSRRLPARAVWRWRRETSGDFDDMGIDIIDPWASA